MNIAYLFLIGAVAILIMVGCFKFGAEFCPPTVVIQHDDGTQSGVRLVRDAGAE